MDYLKIKGRRSKDDVREFNVYRNKNNKFQYISESKHTVCPCEFDTIEDAFIDLAKYLHKYIKLEIEIGTNI